MRFTSPVAAVSCALTLALAAYPASLQAQDQAPAAQAAPQVNQSPGLFPEPAPLSKAMRYVEKRFGEGGDGRSQERLLPRARGDGDRRRLDCAGARLSPLAVQRPAAVRHLRRGVLALLQDGANATRDARNCPGARHSGHTTALAGSDPSELLWRGAGLARVGSQRGTGSCRRKLSVTPPSRRARG